MYDGTQSFFSLRFTLCSLIGDAIVETHALFSFAARTRKPAGKPRISARKAAATESRLPLAISPDVRYEINSCIQAVDRAVNLHWPIRNVPRRSYDYWKIENCGLFILYISHVFCSTSSLLSRWFLVLKYKKIKIFKNRSKDKGTHFMCKIKCDRAIKHL